eukprot:6174570-Pleurochrysis_carterae.AAC.6
MAHCPASRTACATSMCVACQIVYSAERTTLSYWPVFDRDVTETCMHQLVLSTMRLALLEGATKHCDPYRKNRNATRNSVHGDIRDAQLLVGAARFEQRCNSMVQTMPSALLQSPSTASRHESVINYYYHALWQQKVRGQGQ